MDPKAFLFMGLCGEREHDGQPGAVMVDSARGHAKYTPLPEIEPPALRQALAEQMKPDQLYVLHLKDGNVHVFAYPRARAQAELLSGRMDALAAPSPSTNALAATEGD